MAAIFRACDTRPNMLTKWFQRKVLSRRWLAFLVMGLAFFVFGVGTYNFFLMLSANLSLIAEYGWQAIMDGAARQLVELIVTGYLSMAAYVVFKTCEYRLAHDLAGDDPPDRHVPATTKLIDALPKA